MKKGLQYLLFIFLLGFPFVHSYADSAFITTNNPLLLAEKICAVESELYILDRTYLMARVNRSSDSILSKITGFQDRLVAYSDSLESQFRSAVHYPQIDFFYEARKHAWFLYCQDFLRQRGIHLSANNRFDYVTSLPKEGNISVELDKVNRDTLQAEGRYFIDSASFIILNRHYPNWKKVRMTAFKS